MMKQTFTLTILTNTKEELCIGKLSNCLPFNLFEIFVLLFIRGKIIMLLKLLADNVPGMSLLMSKYYVPVSVGQHLTLCKLTSHHNAVLWDRVLSFS